MTPSDNATTPSQSLTLDQALALNSLGEREIISPQDELVKLVIVALGPHRVGFKGGQIREILTRENLFFVPGCPAFVAGVINLRGDIESVLRLALLLDLPPSPDEAQKSILLGQSGSLRSGLLVDQVVDVLDLPQSALLPPMALLPEGFADCVIATLSHGKQSVPLLDLDALFARVRRELDQEGAAP